MYGINKIKAVCKLCRLNKPFLAVPFSITAAFISSKEIPDIKILLCVFIASISGFMAGNAFNGITDIDVDSINPRTQDRPLILQEINILQAFAVMMLSTVIVIISTWLIDFKYVLMLPLPIALCFFYSISKRYTWLCHIILGTVNAVPPVGSWIVFNGFNDYRAVIMGAVVFFWTVGFEIIYSSQDVKYDKLANMKSIPVVFGVSNSYKISAISHIIMTVLLFILMYVCKTGIVFTVGVLIGLIIIIIEHFMICNGKDYNAGKTFDLNQIFSLIIMFFAILDKII